MYQQIVLPYSFDALEPYIDTLTMQTHYTKHYATYTANLNKFAKEVGIDDWPIETLLASWSTELWALPQAQGLRNNGGGFYNHGLYFAELSPNGGGEPHGLLGESIGSTFGSFANFRSMITKLALGVFGSGWAWLNSDAGGNLSLSTSANQDNPILETAGRLTPIFGIDVWEHAYYLKHLNERAAYIEDFFNVVDWLNVADNYRNVLSIQNQ